MGTMQDIKKISKTTNASNGDYMENVCGEKTVDIKMIMWNRQNRLELFLKSAYFMNADSVDTEKNVTIIMISQKNKAKSEGTVMKSLKCRHGEEENIIIFKY